MESFELSREEAAETRSTGTKWITKNVNNWLTQVYLPKILPLNDVRACGGCVCFMFTTFFNVISNVFF